MNNHCRKSAESLPYLDGFELAFLPAKDKDKMGNFYSRKNKEEEKREVEGGRQDDVALEEEEEDQLCSHATSHLPTHLWPLTLGDHSLLVSVLS